MGLIEIPIDDVLRMVYTLYKLKKEDASMQVSLKPWGNSQGVRFSREFLASAGMKPDDVLIAEASEGRIVLRKSFQHRTLKQRAEEFGGSLNLSEEVNWDEPKGNEVW